MPPVGAERWFHTLVVVGASLTGCGGATTDKDMPATGGSGSVMSTGGAASGAASGGGAPTNPGECASAAQFVCDDYPTRTNCRCDPAAPRQMSDCKSPLDYQCIELVCQASPPPGELCFGDVYVACRCEPSGLRPSDCATPEQFFCSVDDRFFSGCECSPTPPPTECGSLGVCCQSDNPRFGCECCELPTIIK